jgi:hypothetical protein
MQYVLQISILHTCHESAQSGPSIVCFHLSGYTNYNNGNHNKKLLANVFHNGWWKCGHMA